MARSIDFDSEPKYRKEYWQTQINKILRNNGKLGSYSKDEFTENLMNILDQNNPSKLERNINSYVQGLFEDQIEPFINNAFKGHRKEKLMEKTIKFKAVRKQKIKGKQYKASSYAFYGYSKGKKVKARVEQRLIKGKLRFRLRDTKGRFVKILKE